VSGPVVARAALAGVVALSFVACRRPPPGPCADCSVVLVSIDTLRADRLPAYGYAKGRTPHLDALARRGILFEEAYSHCPLTLPAHASLLTGLLPPRHGVRDNVGFTLSPAHGTLAARFKAAGFRTGGAVSAYVLRRQTGIAEGFDEYDDALESEGAVESLAAVQRDGAVAVESLARWIESQEKARFFAFLHLYEPHTPYAPPERFRGGDLYDGEVSYADELVGRLLDRVEGKDRLIVAVTGDHGEGLGDHGEAEHGIFLYRESLRVPLLLRLPRDAGAGTRVAAPVAQVDIPATLLALAGVPADGLDGVSLVPALAGGAVPARRVYSETFYPRYHFGWSELRSVTEERYRYIEAPRRELFDLKEDPTERRNVADERASAVAAMSQWLEQQSAGTRDVAAPGEVDPETREKLQSLGYIGVSPSLTLPDVLPDPKDKIAAYEQLKHALALRQAQQDEEAVAAFRKVLADNPTMIDAWEMLGYTLIRLGRTKEGIESVDRALRLDPMRTTAHLALAKVYALEGRDDLARQHAEIASGRNPAQGTEALAQLMMEKGDLAKAASYARRSVAADPDRIMSRFILGVAARSADRCEEAVEEFRRAEAAKNRQKRVVVRSLHAQLGDCLARLGRDAEAEAEFQADLQAIPQSEDARVGLAMLYRSQGRDAESRSALKALVTAAPRPETYLKAVQTATVLGDVEAARALAAEAHARFPGDGRFH
jgi:choline-sulfatase